MNRALVLVLAVFAASPLFAQIGPGVVEASISASLQSISSGSGSSSTNVLISPRLGFFVHEGLEIEPEFILFLPDGGDPTYVLNANVGYNFLLSGKAHPFFLLGYGIANTVPLFGLPITRYDFTVGVLNIGAGVKIFLLDRVALRGEYRFQKFVGESTQQAFGFSYTRKADIQMHTVHFGFSVLL